MIDVAGSRRDLFVSAFGDRYHVAEVAQLKAWQVTEIATGERLLVSTKAVEQATIAPQELARLIKDALDDNADTRQIYTGRKRGTK